jgi:hypothetical protein
MKYPTLEAILDPAPEIRAALRSAISEFASTGGEDVTRFCNNLDKFANTCGSHSGSPKASNTFDMHNIKFIVPPKAYPRCVNQHMYTILSEYSRCTCTPSVGLAAPSQHCARLRLIDKVRASQDDVWFDMQFSHAHASVAHPSAMKWQQLSFQIPWHVVLEFIQELLVFY